jgi:hypothetical protein
MQGRYEDFEYVKPVTKPANAMEQAVELLSKLAKEIEPERMEAMGFKKVGEALVEPLIGKTTPVFRIGTKEGEKVATQFKVGDRVAAKFNNIQDVREGNIVNLDPKGDGKVAVRFDHYAYMGPTDFHTWDPRLLTPVRDKKAEALAKYYGMAVDRMKSRTPGDPLGYPHATYVATFVLASGREVEMPLPDSKVWEEVQLSDDDRKAVEKIVPASAAWSDNKVLGDFSAGPTSFVVEHREGLCWLMDMARHIRAEEKLDAFTIKFAYVKKLRKFRERIIDAEFEYEGALPTLRAYLW